MLLVVRFDVGFCVVFYVSHIMNIARAEILLKNAKELIGIVDDLVR